MVQVILLPLLIQVEAAVGAMALAVVERHMVPAEELAEVEAVALVVQLVAMELQHPQVLVPPVAEHTPVVVVRRIIRLPGMVGMLSSEVTGVLLETATQQLEKNYI